MMRSQAAVRRVVALIVALVLVLVLVLAAGVLAAGVLAADGPGRAVAPAAAASAGPIAVQPDCLGLRQAGGILAVTVGGELDAVAPGTRRSTEIASGIAPHGGVAVRPQLDTAYVTATGPDGHQAIWSVPLNGCHPQSSVVVPDAELPSVSPDGGYLGFVTLNRRGGQTGVAIVRLGRRGRPAGPPRTYRATSIPPPLPIRAVAVGRRDAVLAVWGGSIDAYLGPRRLTVSTLVPSTARSLRALVPVFDAQGVSMASAPSGRQDRPKDWQSTPVYLPNGNFLVGDHGRDITMPFTTGNGGGIRSIATDTGPLVSLATGPDGALAWVEKGGGLVVSPHAVELPFGPGADTAPRTTAAPLYLAHGQFTAVAWTEGPRAESTPLPRVFQYIPHLPSVVGLSLVQATHIMDGLDLPVFLAATAHDPDEPAGTVLAQDPPAGDGVACQCSISLTVNAAASPGSSL